MWYNQNNWISDNMVIKKGRKYEHFKSKKAYKKYEAYIHIHKIPHKHRKTVVIKGKKHKVKHWQ